MGYGSEKVIVNGMPVKEFSNPMNPVDAGRRLQMNGPQLCLIDIEVDHDFEILIDQMGGSQDSQFYLVEDN